MALPFDQTLVRIMTIMLILFLIFTYPIYIYPFNTAFEKYTIDKLIKTNSNTKYWVKNITRLILCISVAYMGIELQNEIDWFLGFVGAVLCAPLAFIIPCLCHLKLLAKDNNEKI